MVSTLTLTSSAALFNVSPTFGSIHGGTLLTIHGNGFPRLISYVQVLIGSRACSIVRTVPDQIQCLVPAQGSTVSPASIRVMFNGITLRSSSNFTYDVRVTPNITSVSPTSGFAGQRITLFGSNFIPDQTNVSIGDTPCSLINVTSSTIACMVNSSPAGNRGVWGKRIEYWIFQYEYSISICFTSQHCFSNNGKFWWWPVNQYYWRWISCIESDSHPL